MADANGNISDSSFAPDSLDLGITFYVTATQEGPADANGQPTILTAQTSFTDGVNIDIFDSTCKGQQGSQFQTLATAAAFGQQICVSAKGLGNGASSVVVGWFQPNSSNVFYSTVAVDNGNFQDIEVPNAGSLVYPWTVKVYTDNTLATEIGSAQFYVGDFSGHLQFIT